MVRNWDLSFTLDIFCLDRSCQTKWRIK